MYRVIIADDEPKVSLLIKALIHWEELGLELVATAGDGLSALAAIEEFRPDIVITDIRMPGYDGIELISRAKGVNPSMDFVIISGYRHFEYAQQAIRFGVEDYLLKPLKAVEINGTLQKMVTKYRERDQEKRQMEDYSVRAARDAEKRQGQFLAGLLTQTEPFIQSLAQINEACSLTFKAGPLQAFLVKSDVHFESLNSNVTRLVTEKCTAMIKENLLHRCDGFMVYSTEQGVYGLANLGESGQSGLRKALMAVIDGLQAQSELFDRIKVTAGLGRASESMGDMPSSLREAEAAVANRLLVGAGRIIDPCGVPDKPEIIPHLITAEVRRQLLRGVEIMDPDEIRSVFEGLYAAVQTEPHISGATIRLMAEECIQILRFGLKSQSAMDEWIEEEQGFLRVKLDSCNRLKDIFTLLGAYGTAMVSHVSELRRTENSRPVRESQKYIHANFSTTITLESLSQRAGFNAAYFSQLFKKETGMNFLEYLTDVRIREAKRLLAESGKTIADVAGEVGYSDVKHFSKLFTRSTGIHPSKYRKLYY